LDHFSGKPTSRPIDEALDEPRSPVGSATSISREVLIGSETIWERGAALTWGLQSLETEMSAEEEVLLAEGQVF
jgi:hypothetical protein